MSKGQRDAEILMQRIRDAEYKRAADQPAPTPRTVMEGTPETIYLQTGGGDDPEMTFDQLGEVTWCVDWIERDDTKYIRADIAERELSAAKAEAERLREALTDQIQWVAAFAMGLGQHETVMSSDRMKRALAATRKEEGARVQIEKEKNA